MKSTLKYLLVAMGLLLGLAQAQAQNLIPVKNKEGKYGFIDAQGKLVVAYQYDNLSRESRGYAAFKDQGKWGMLYKGKVIVPPIFDDIDTPNDQGYMRCSNGGGKAKRHGLADTTGKVLIAPQYNNKLYMSEGMIAVKNNEGKYGYVNIKNERIIDFKYAYASSFSNGRAKVQLTQKGKYGYINKKGKLVIKPKYAKAYSFEDNLATVKDSSSDLYYLINKRGQRVGKLEFYHTGSFNSGLMPVQLSKRGKYGYVNQQGQMVIAPQYDYARDFSKDKASVKLGDENYEINTKGVRQTNAALSKRFTIKQKDGLYYMYNSTGTQALSKGYAAIDIPTGKNAIEQQYPLRVKQGDTYGFINYKGEEICPPNLQAAKHFYNDITLITYDNLKGYLDTKGNYIIMPYFDIAESFYTEVAVFSVFKERLKYSYKDGNHIAYPRRRLHPESPYLVGSILSGLVDKKGKIVLYPRYQRIFYDYQKKVFHAAIGGDVFDYHRGKEGIILHIINTKGRVIWQSDKAE